MKYDSVVIVSIIPGNIPDLKLLPEANMTAVNIADDIIYRNVDGNIVRYIRENKHIQD